MAAKRPGKIRSGFVSSNPAPRPTTCLETTDSTVLRQPATFLDSMGAARDRQAQLARLANQFIRQNQGILDQFGVIAEMAYDGSNVDLISEQARESEPFHWFHPKVGARIWA